MGPPQGRDESWFTRIYADQYAHIVSYGQRRLGDPEASAELAQEVFVIAWRRRTEMPDRSLPWLYGVARRLLANHWRARRAAPEVLPIGDESRLWEPVSSGPEARVGITDIRAALATLDRILCNPSVGWYLGEVTLAAPPPLEDLKLLELDTPVCFLSFRNPNQSAVLHAMYALSRVAGPMFVFAEKKFVVSPEDSMDRMAAHWPW
jgi:hypothetical protein